jgi:hypothetical protein
MLGRLIPAMVSDCEDGDEDMGGRKKEDRPRKPDLQVVRTLDAAYQLLNVESPEFVPVAQE